MPTVAQYDSAVEEVRAELAQLRAVQGRAAELMAHSRQAELGALETARSIRALAESVPAAAVAFGQVVTPALGALKTLRDTASALDKLIGGGR